MTNTFVQQFGPAMGTGKGFIDSYIDTNTSKTTHKPWTGEVYFKMCKDFAGERFIVIVREFKYKFMFYAIRANEERLAKMANGTLELPK